MHILLSVVVFVAFVSALVDIILRDQSQVKHLPKFGWVMLVIFLPLIGAVLWFTLGREYAGSAGENITFGDPRRWDRTEQAPAPPAVRRDTRSTEQQLADLEREIEEDRRRNSARDSGASGVTGA